MRTYTVELPSGQSIPVTLPEGASQEQILREAMRKVSPAAATQGPSPADFARAEFDAMPGWQQLAVGAGNQANNLRLGAKQFLNIGDQQQLQREIDANRAYSDATWGSPMGAIGNVGGILAPAVAMPAGGAAGLAGRALSAARLPALGARVGTSLAADGALYGAGLGMVTPTGTNESAVAQTVLGAAGGAAGGKVADMIGRRLAARALPPVSDADLAAQKITQTYGPEALARLQKAQSLPLPIALDAGQATGDTAIQNTIHASRQAIGGGALQRSWDEQDDLLRGNLDELMRRTGGSAEYMDEAGRTNSGASISNWYKRASGVAKRRAGLLFKLADRREGGVEATDLSPLLARLYEDAHKGASMNSSMPQILALLQRYGIGIGEDGIPRSGARIVTLRDLNQIRQSVSEMASAGGTAGHDARLVLNSINDTFEKNGGTLYPAAVRAWKGWAREFANTDTAGLVKGTLADVASGARGPANFADERLIDTILSKSVTAQDITRLRDSMLRQNANGVINPAGLKAWRDLQANTLQAIKSRATFGDREVTELSAPKLNQAIVESIGRAKLRAILGEDIATALSDVNDVAQTVKLVARQPGTTPALMNLMGELPVVGQAARLANRATPSLKAMLAARNYGPGWVARAGKGAREELVDEALWQQVLNSSQLSPLYNITPRATGLLAADMAE